MDVRLTQSLKQLSPKVVTEIGILIEARLVQYAKHSLPKDDIFLLL